MRSKSGSKGTGRTERDYKRARLQVLKDSWICALCGEAIDHQNTKPICRFLDVSLWVVGGIYPATCSEECDHPRKAHPFSPSADHKIPVADLPPGSPLLTSVKNLQSAHLKCNRDRGAGDGTIKPLYLTSKDHYS